MQKEKINAHTEDNCMELMEAIIEMLPRDWNSREQKRDALKEIYLTWMNNTGCEMAKETRREYGNLYHQIDHMFKISNKFSYQELQKLLEEK